MFLFLFVVIVGWVCVEWDIWVIFFLLIVLWFYVIYVEKIVLIDIKIDECSLNVWFEIDDFVFIDVVNVIILIGVFDIEFFENIVF